MDFILALDQGTTSSRAIVFDRAGSICSVAQQEFPQHFPQPGWVEHDPDDIWNSQIAVAQEALRSAGVSKKQLAGIGIANQRETTILWDRQTGRPVCNAIVWQDRRTAPICERLKEAGHEPFFRHRTGLLLDPYFSGTKVRWMLDHVEGVRERAERGEIAFGTVDSWLIWNLTDGKRHVTDPSNAARTLLYNLRDGDWDDELLEILGVPRALLPGIVPSSGVCGEAARGSILEDTPIAGIAGDQSAALFGQSCFRPGMAKNTYGTGCFLLLNTGAQPMESQHRLLTTVGWHVGERTEYALEGSVFIAGAVVQWLRDGLGIIARSADVESLAASVPDAGGAYLVPAFSGLGAPYWDPYARGALVGMTRGTTAAHVARAALEAIAHQSADVLEAMRLDAGLRLAELRVDGGAAANNLLLQFQADLLQAPVVRPKVTETTALGAAYLAGLAVGFWKDREEISGQWAADRIFEPTRSESEMDSLRAGWKRAVERSRAWERAE